MRSVGLGFWIAAVAAGCGGLNSARPLVGAAAADAGSSTPTVGGQTQGTPPAPPARDAGPDSGAAVDSGVTPRDAGPGGAPPDAGAANTPDAGAAPHAGDGGQPLCPALDAPPTLPDLDGSGWSPPTAVPFSCAPLPNALFFPRPGSETPNAYARCASFADARPSSLAINPDGTRVVLLGTDGVGRVIDVASHMVVGLLAPPRASIGLAAFSPDGRTILTFARGERLLSLWRADTFAPIWNATLPGHTYFNEYTGAATFSPDGTTVLLALDNTIVLVDAATGAVRKTSALGTGLVLSAVYGWNGQRIAAVTSRLSGMCIFSPVGGAVTVLDATTLTPVATPQTWFVPGDEGPGPGQVMLSAAADLMVTSGSVTGTPSIAKAFRLSDGSPLPDPALLAFPLALSPDGTSAVV
jgi:hypothetical protein